MSTSAALKIGTEGVADFENVLVENCIIESSNRGISIQIRDSGCVRNVHFKNILIETRRFSHEWWGTAEPIAITCYDRDEGTDVGSVENVSFENIRARGENGVLLAGKAGKIRDITFRNVDISLVKHSKWETEGHDIRPKYDEPSFLGGKVGVLDAENVENLILDGFTHTVSDYGNFDRENPVRFKNVTVHKGN